MKVISASSGIGDSCPMFEPDVGDHAVVGSLHRWSELDVELCVGNGDLGLQDPDVVLSPSRPRSCLAFSRLASAASTFAMAAARVASAYCRRRSEIAPGSSALILRILTASCSARILPASAALTEASAAATLATETPTA